MNVATKALVSMMLVAMFSMGAPQASAISRPVTTPRDNRLLQRQLKKLDRRYELRASILGMTSTQLRSKLRSQTFAQVARQAGFKTETSFQRALVGKLKDELARRGITDQKIQRFVAKRLDRLSRSSAA